MMTPQVKTHSQPTTSSDFDRAYRALFTVCRIARSHWYWLVQENHR